MCFSSKFITVPHDVISRPCSVIVALPGYLLYYGKCPKILNTISYFFGLNFAFYAVVYENT